MLFRRDCAALTLQPSIATAGFRRAVHMTACASGVSGANRRAASDCRASALPTQICGESNISVMEAAAEEGVPRFVFVSVHDFGFPGAAPAPAPREARCLPSQPPESLRGRPGRQQFFQRRLLPRAGWVLVEGMPVCDKEAGGQIGRLERGLGPRAPSAAWLTKRFSVHTL